MTTTKKSLKNTVSTQQKKNIETDYQDDDEIIDINEVRRRKGITGEKVRSGRTAPALRSRLGWGG